MTEEEPEHHSACRCRECSARRLERETLSQKNPEHPTIIPDLETDLR